MEGNCTYEYVIEVETMFTTLITKSQLRFVKRTCRENLQFPPTFYLLILLLQKKGNIMAVVDIEVIFIEYCLTIVELLVIFMKYYLTTMK